jgi:hypothetical protein
MKLRELIEKLEDIEANHVDLDVGGSDWFGDIIDITNVYLHNEGYVFLDIEDRGEDPD